MAIRLIATAALTTIAAVFAAVKFGALWFWPVAIVGAAFAGWTLYAHLLRKDPLVEQFYKIVGGKEAFQQLPEIVLTKKAGQDLITGLDWDQFKHGIARAKTEDGRQVLLVKALSRDAEMPTKALFAFVEKLGPSDSPRVKEESFAFKGQRGFCFEGSGGRQKCRGRPDEFYRFLEILTPSLPLRLAKQFQDQL